MFLIEYKKGFFVDREKVTWLSVSDDRVCFSLSDDSVFVVDTVFFESFLSSIQSINDNKIVRLSDLIKG